MELGNEYRSKAVSKDFFDIDSLIDNCLGFLYSVELDSMTANRLKDIELALYENFYCCESQKEDEYKKRLFENEIVPIFNEIAPRGCYFGRHTTDFEFFGFWEKSTVSDGSICA
ncbi:MAG TPA: hypothetical protein PKV75_04715 [Desulfobacterales bacterium]|nr:hypothetical protein [Desulfobacterales bacterium]